MIELLNKYIIKSNIPDNKNQIIAGVSGGIDSMVLLHLMLRAGYNVTVAHCNFSLRGNESDSDQNFVEKKCRDLDIPLHCVRFNTDSYAKEKGISIQMAARELRFKWFNDLSVQLNIPYIALAHNRNDIAETMLINLLRGTGLSGLTGIKPISDNIIRPLLFATRDMITGYATENNIAFREDSSNSETKYLRNRIRHIVIPAMDTTGSDTVERLTETAGRLSEACEIINSEISRIHGKLFTQKEGLIYVSRSELRSLKPLATYLYELFTQYGISSGQVNELINLLGSGPGKVITTHSHQILSDRSKIVIKPLSENITKDIIIDSEESLLAATGIFSVEKISPGSLKQEYQGYVAWFDATRLNYPLTIRKWEPGDYFQPFGMAGKSKKVSDILTEKKLSKFQKENVYLLLSGDEIAWVIGIRTDERFRITPLTTSAIKITAKKNIL